MFGDHEGQAAVLLAGDAAGGEALLLSAALAEVFGDIAGEAVRIEPGVLRALAAILDEEVRRHEAREESDELLNQRIVRGLWARGFEIVAKRNEKN